VSLQQSYSCDSLSNPLSVSTCLDLCCHFSTNKSTKLVTSQFTSVFELAHKVGNTFYCKSTASTSSPACFWCISVFSHSTYRSLLIAATSNWFIPSIFPRVFPSLFSPSYSFLFRTWLYLWVLPGTLIISWSQAATSPSTCCYWKSPPSGIKSHCFLFFIVPSLSTCFPNIAAN